MRVLFVNPIGTLGGAEQCLLDMLAALAQSGGFETSLIAFADGPLLARARDLGVSSDVVELPSSIGALGETGFSWSAGARGISALGASVADVARFGRRLHRAVVGVAPSLVHTNGVKAHWSVGAFAPLRTPVVAHVHDYLSERTLSRHLPKLLVRRRATVIANSASVAQDVRELAPGLAIATVHNAIDVDYFAPGPGDRAWLASSAGMAEPSPETVCFALVATYARWKGQALAIEAFSALRESLSEPPCRLYIVGGPIYETMGSQFSVDELREVASACRVRDEVGFVPFQSDTARVYRSADVVVHASTRREAFGRTIVEGMACGRAVVVARAGGATEVFRDGVSALGFESGNAASLAAAFARLAKAPRLRAELGASARSHATRYFDRSRLGPELKAVYEAALARGW